jgi:hypothetical protein
MMMMNASSRQNILSLLWAQCPEEMMALYREEADRRIKSNVARVDNNRTVIAGQSTPRPLLQHYLYANE